MEKRCYVVSKESDFDYREECFSDTVGLLWLHGFINDVFQTIFLDCFFLYLRQRKKQYRNV